MCPFPSLWYFKKVHLIQKHIFRKCMLISYQIAEGTQLKTGTLKRSFVVQNKLHGPQNNACSTAKCISKKRGDSYNSEKCAAWAGKQPVLGLICAHGEGNGCFVASDWLKRRWIKACHVLSIHYLKKKHLDSSLAGRSLFFSLFVRCEHVC